MASLCSERPIHASSHLSPVSSSLPSKQCNVCLAEHRPFTASEGGHLWNDLCQTLSVNYMMEKQRQCCTFSESDPCTMMWNKGIAMLHSRSGPVCTTRQYVITSKVVSDFQSKRSYFVYMGRKSGSLSR